MSVDEQKNEEYIENGGELDIPIDMEIPINDRRRFNEKGERIRDGETVKPTEPAKSAREIELESKLKAEIERREAAEGKLVGVQAKFDEAKNNLERETAQMRERLRKTLESSAKQAQFDFLATILP
ncbi:MAG TPA: hypothetical protein VEV84_10445, partial [Pyrinomonadaceae bacterium]|nr:hypothetical protein [Pyrinomonadaceae bacterium]